MNAATPSSTAAPPSEACGPISRITSRVRSRPHWPPISPPGPPSRRAPASLSHADPRPGPVTARATRHRAPRSHGFALIAQVAPTTPTAFVALAALLLLLASFVLITPPALAQPITAAPPEGPIAQAIASERFRHLASELRCLVCQNQTLSDSNAPLAQDLRNEVARLMVAGKTDDEIKHFLTDRYGEFVLYRPAFSARNALLWVGPFLLLAVGVFAWWRLGRRRHSSEAGEADLARVDELLDR